MRTWFLTVLLASGTAHAGCSQIASARTDTVLIDIGSGGCATDEDMIVFATKKPAEAEYSKLSDGVPFLKECSLTKTGFKCRPDGSTPLAGATYKKVKFGRSGNACDTDGELGEKYVCVAGCSRPGVPAYLLGFDGSC